MDFQKPTGAPANRIGPEDVTRTLKREYDFASRDQFDKSIDAINRMIGEISRPDLDIKNLADFTVKMIYRQFHLKEISIGLKSNSDGLFRYVAMMGMRANVWAEHQDLTYDNDSLFDDEVYKFTNIGKLTKVFLAENNPYGSGEEGTYNEHLSTASKRKRIDDCIEGDYMDVLIFNGRDQLCGWIEFSGTWEEKFPSIQVIKSIEIIASLFGVAMTIRQYG